MNHTKQELRNTLKQKRADLPPEEKKKLDSDIVARIAASAEFQNATAVLLYAPMKGEIDLLPLVRLCRRSGKTVAFPRCDTEQCTMRFYVLEPDARLVSGAYHIPEPAANAPLCVPDEKALCILPGLTFDPQGGRLGYGKGYYDRFLCDFPGITAGAVYERMLVRKVPTEPHDLPVSILFTERGKCVCRRSAEIETASKSKESTPASFGFTTRVKEKATALLDACRQGFPKAKKSKVYSTDVVPAKDGEAVDVPKSRTWGLHAPPVLVLSTFVLLLLSRLIDTYLTDRNNEYAVVILLQLLIFLIPAVTYGKLRGEKFPERIRMHPIRKSHWWFTFCILVMMITGGLLCGILTGGIASLTGNFTLYSTFVARINNSAMGTVYVILAYCLLPAFCEELIYRSILCAEYERFGVPVAIGASALFFAMLHFSFPLFLTYLFLGALLAGAMYATRSFFTAFLLHFFYNLFCLFGQPYLSAFYVNAGSNEIFIFCLVTLFLLFGAFAAGEARKIYHQYARNNVDSSYTVSVPAREIPQKFLQALFTPVTAVCIVIWLIMAIVNIL